MSKLWTTGEDVYCVSGWLWSLVFLEDSKLWNDSFNEWKQWMSPTVVIYPSKTACYLSSYQK